MTSPGVERRTVFDAQFKLRLPGVLSFSEMGDDPSKVDTITDPVARDAYKNSGVTYSFYQELFKRNSID